MARREAAGTNEVDTVGVRVGEAAGSGAIGVDSWLRMAGKEIGVPVGRVFAVLQRVSVRGEERQPALDASIVLPCRSDILERFVIRVSAELGRLKVTALSLGGQNHTTGFKVSRGVQERSEFRV